MDLHNNVKASRAISPVNEGGNTAIVSEILAVANFDTNELLIASGSLADAGATFTLLLEHSDDPAMSGAVAVPDDDLIGTEAGASFTQAEDNTVKKLGYKGKYSYLRATLTPAGNAADAYFSAIWLQANPRKAPQA